MGNGVPSIHQEERLDRMAGEQMEELILVHPEEDGGGAHRIPWRGGGQEGSPERARAEEERPAICTP
jgi:hypothetical protein